PAQGPPRLAGVPRPVRRPFGARLGVHLSRGTAQTADDLRPQAAPTRAARAHADPDRRRGRAVRRAGRVPEARDPARWSRRVSTERPHYQPRGAGRLQRRRARLPAAGRDRQVGHARGGLYLDAAVGSAWVTRSTRRDALPETKHVPWIVPGLDLHQPLEIRAVGGPRPSRQSG